jgi:hypothetical protein
MMPIIAGDIAMPTHELGLSPELKAELMFEGVRYSEALAEAAEHALPNYYPYKFQKGEPDPTGTGKAKIPYLMRTDDDTLIRVMGNGGSPWSVQGSRDQGYRLQNEADERFSAITFEPQREWLSKTTSDGFPMAQAGVSTHGDMLIINVAPGCEYFLKKHDSQSMRCTFCSYGAPDERTAYLVGGSLTDPALEGERFLHLARAVKEHNPDGVPVCLGSGALPADMIRQFHEEKLVDAVCFNLEIWSEKLFSQVCPGKNRYVGYEGWIGALEQAVELWGTGRVYSAMVAGVELEPEHGMEWQDAAALAVEGASDLCSRGIIPIYSLYWPTGGKGRSDYQSRLRNFFEQLAGEYKDIRHKHDLKVWDGFMCHRCAYMQLECDVERSAA